jgi:acetophenone carboxylase
LGGDKATLTDAFVSAGLIDPVNFLGGAKPLQLDAAREVIQSQISTARGISIEQACGEIIDSAFNLVADMISRASRELGQDLSDHVLLAYGGNGGLFACGVAERAGIGQVYLLALGPVFSAFGSSVSDISHVYERSFPMTLRNAADLDPLNRLLDEMSAQGNRDLLGEGIAPEGADCALELEMFTTNGVPPMAKSSQPRFNGLAELRRSIVPPLAGDDTVDLVVDLVRMRVKKAIAKPALTKKKKGGSDSSAARVGTGTVSYNGKPQEAALYRWESLQPGNSLQGCALLESANSTYFVLPDWNLEIDGYGNALLKRNR